MSKQLPLQKDICTCTATIALFSCFYQSFVTCSVLLSWHGLVPRLSPAFVHILYQFFCRMLYSIRQKAGEEPEYEATLGTGKDVHVNIQERLTKILTTLS